MAPSIQFTRGSDGEFEVLAELFLSARRIRIGGGDTGKFGREIPKRFCSLFEQHPSFALLQEQSRQKTTTTSQKSLLWNSFYG